MVSYKYKTLIVEKEGGIAKVIMNRPEALNAMNPELLADLRDILVRLPGDESIKVVVLTGAGRAFCAGGDVKGMEQDQNQPVRGHEGMTIGLSQFRDSKRLTLPWLLILPFFEAGKYPFNHRSEK